VSNPNLRTKDLLFRLDANSSSVGVAEPIAGAY
jgi:hypothetical protein